MRVVLSKRNADRWRPHLTPPPRVAEAFARVRRGLYTEAGGMGILEPVEVYDSNVKATAAATAAAKKHPNETFVVVLNADPEELAKDPDADGAMSS